MLFFVKTKKYQTKENTQSTELMIGGISGISEFEIPLPIVNGISFHFDTQISRLSATINEERVQLNYGFIRLPKDLYQAQNNKFDEFPSLFICQIYFSKWNALENQNRIHIYFSNTTTKYDT